MIEERKSYKLKIIWTWSDVRSQRKLKDPDSTLRGRFLHIEEALFQLTPRSELKPPPMFSILDTKTKFVAVHAPKDEFLSTL